MGGRKLAAWVRTPGGRRTIADLGFLAALYAFVALAYGPSLNHPPRADQWCFLADTERDHTFADTLRHSYSYNRTRRVAPGDTDLFRPVLFALLAAEKACFEGRLALSQGFGIVLHCVLCAQLLFLCRRSGRLLQPETGSDSGDALLYATVAFFALNPSVQELVIWSHLHGYLLFLILLLGSASCLFGFIERARQGEPAVGRLWAGWLLALAAAFTYELGQFYAVLVGLLLATVGPCRIVSARAAGRFVLFAGIVVIYQAVNRIDMAAHEGQYRPDNLEPVILAKAASRETVSHSARFGVYTAVQPFFPAQIQTSYGGQRLQIAESLWSAKWTVPATPSVAVSLAAFAVAVALGLAGLIRYAREGRWLHVQLLLPLGLYLGYAAITVLGRMNLRPVPGVISSNSYYAYPALLFALLTASVLWQAVGEWGGFLRKSLAAGLAALSLLGADHLHRSNVAIARAEREWSRPIRAVQRFIDAHRHEPGFGIEIDYAGSDPIPQIHGRRITQLLFAKWLSVPSPRYHLTLKDGKVVARERDTRTCD